MKLLAKKRLPKPHPRHCALMLAAALGLALLAAPNFVGLAQAFTIDDRSTTNPDGTAKFSDTDPRRFGSGTDGQTTIRQGNTTFQFGGQRSFDQRYSKEQMFEPNGRPLGER